MLSSADLVAQLGSNCKVELAILLHTGSLEQWDSDGTSDLSIVLHHDSVGACQHHNHKHPESSNASAEGITTCHTFIPALTSAKSRRPFLPSPPAATAMFIVTSLELGKRTQKRSKINSSIVLGKDP
jgi:hypothetical protein